VNICFRSEFKANHAEWVNTVKPKLGPGIQERVHEAITSEDGPMEDFHALKTEFKSALSALIKVLQRSENFSAPAAFLNQAKVQMILNMAVFG
jgi:hypothetical protein